MLNALEVQKLIEKIEHIILKPSDYTMIESTILFRECKTAIETLYRASENAIQQQSNIQ